DVLRFGPMKPVGLPTEAFAVVQLRQEDRAGQMWNLVGFQTRLKVPEQQRVFRMIPGLERAEFLRFGSIHRNAYINSPRALTAHPAMVGGLYRSVHTADGEHFRPMNANFGLLEPLERRVKDKQRKRELLVERALREWDTFATRVNAERGTRDAEPTGETSAPRS